jgi:hypothetical protein
MDGLFDITEETNMVKEIKDILDELNIIQCVKRQQDAVICGFERDMLQKAPGTEKDFYDGTRLRDHADELNESAQATYTAVSFPIIESFVAKCYSCETC